MQSSVFYLELVYFYRYSIDNNVLIKGGIAMQKKLFWFPLLASLLPMVLLYTIGNIFNISLLSWTFYEENPSEGVAFEAGGSLIPVFIGIIAGFVTERLLKNKQKNGTAGLSN